MYMVSGEPRPMLVGGRPVNVEEPLTVSPHLTLPVTLTDPTSPCLTPSGRHPMQIHMEEPPGDILVFLTGQVGGGGRGPKGRDVN